MDIHPAQAAADVAGQFFSNHPDVHLEDITTSGSGAIFIRMKRWRTRRVFDRLMMKMVYEDPPPYPLQNELNALQDFQYSMHVIKPRPIPDESTPTPEPTRFLPLLNPLRPKGLPYEHYFTEDLPNGNLNQLIQRRDADVDHREDRFPNRFLIRIFLCAARACTAMAWPPGQHADNFGLLRPEPALEDEVRDPLLNVHGAVWFNHWLFGHVYHHNFEHSIVPIMKLAGFDHAYVHNGVETVTYDTPEYDQQAQIVRRTRPRGLGNPATRANVLGIGVLMGNMILEDTWLNADEVREQLGARHEWARNTNPGYDPDLIELIARCLAVEPMSRPTIYEIVRDLENWLWYRRAEYYWEKPGGYMETDEALNQFCQRYMYNAPE
ncbi:hypothetical protein PG987_007211 [Apiospora arundinis]